MATDFEKEIMQAFVESIRRFRWAILTTVLISTLLVVHTYLENGFTAKQLPYWALDTYITDAQASLDTERAQLEAKYLASRLYTESLRDLARDEEVIALAESYVRTKMHQNMVDKNIVQDQTIPLLGYRVPGNDYVPIMALLLVVISIGSWLSARSVLAAITSAFEGPSEQAKKLINLHFLFTVPLDQKNWLAVAIQHLAIWYPLFALGLAAYFDMAGPLVNIEHVLLPPGVVYGRLVLLVVLIVALCFFSFCTSQVAVAIDLRTQSGSKKGTEITP